MKMILFFHILKERPNSAGFGAFNQVVSSGGSMTEARKAASEAAKNKKTMNLYSDFKNRYIVVGETEKAFKIVVGYRFNENAESQVIDLDPKGLDQELFTGYPVYAWTPKSQIENGNLKDWVRRNVIRDTKIGRNVISNRIII